MSVISIFKKRKLVWLLALGLLLVPFLVIHFRLAYHQAVDPALGDQRVKLHDRGGAKRAVGLTRRTDDDQQYMDLFKGLDEPLTRGDTVHSYAHAHKDFGQPQCGCRGDNWRQNALHPANTTMVQIKPPKRRFHSNHWFHMGEYFLSQHRSAEVTDVVRAGDTILFMATDVKFVNQLTFTSAFFLLLALSSGEGVADGSILRTRLEVYEPSYVYKQHASSSYSSFWGSFASYGPSVVLDLSQKEHVDGKNNQFQRINLLDTHHVREEISAGKQCHCGKLIDTLGASPVPSARWFRDADEVQELRDKAGALCAVSNSETGYKSSDVYYFQRKFLMPFSIGGGGGGGSSNGVQHQQLQSERKKTWKLTLYERDANRHFAGLDALLHNLDARLDAQWDINVLVHNEDVHPCHIYHELHNTDVYVTTHGFQSTAVMFMPVGSVIIEIFPFRYWKPSYIPLAAQFGVRILFYYCCSSLFSCL
jgi:hypothetical protein